MTRVDNTLAVAWSPSDAPINTARAVEYDVVVDLSDGRKLLKVALSSDHAVTIDGVDAATGAQVTVAALRADDTQGAARSVTLAPGASSVANWLWHVCPPTGPAVG